MVATGDNDAMDTTPVTELIEHMRSLDPADAPRVADELADRLADTLDGGAPEEDRAPDTTGDPS